MAEAPTAPVPRSSGNAGGPPDHTVPLLTLITQRSLDADYEHVAARRRETGAAPPAHPLTRRTAGLVLLAFGLLVTVAAVQTSRNASASDASRETLIEQVNLRRQGLSDLQSQLSNPPITMANGAISGLIAANETIESMTILLPVQGSATAGT